MISEEVSGSCVVSGTVLLIGAGPVSQTVAHAIDGFAASVVAADGGAATALSLGLRPEVVIGDLDSLDVATRESLTDAMIIHDRDQNTTDFQKCLARIEADLVLGAGFIGGRLDHTLAALTAMLEARRRNVLLLGEDDVVIEVRSDLVLDLEPGTRVSLYPMGQVRGRSEGLHWPIDGLSLSPSDRIATSNMATGRVSIEADGPMLAILPLACLTHAVDALRRARSR